MIFVSYLVHDQAPEHFDSRIRERERTEKEKENACLIIYKVLLLLICIPGSIGASDTVSSHGDYNSLLDESCETLPEGSLGQVGSSGFSSAATSHGKNTIHSFSVYFL